MPPGQTYKDIVHELNQQSLELMREATNKLNKALDELQGPTTHVEEFLKRTPLNSFSHQHL